jgi:hypothetical protein
MGNPVILDLTVHSSLAPSRSRLSQSSRGRGLTATTTVRPKHSMRKSSGGKIWTHHGLMRFVPLGIEVLGGMSNNLRGLLLSLSTIWETHFKISKSIAFNFMVKRLSVELQRWNARHLSETLWFLSSSLEPPDTFHLSDIEFVRDIVPVAENEYDDDEFDLQFEPEELELLDDFLFSKGNSVGGLNL